MRILVAEDETIIRLDLRELLERAGFDVCAEARDGVEAVELARSEQPDLAVLDVKMPRLDGIEAARRILDERPIPIVMLTAYGQEELVSRAIEAGVFGYLVKPFREQDLLPAIRTARARHEELAALREQADSLAEALASRKSIERAKGLLMEREGLSEQEAFARLRKASQVSGRPMKVVAEAVVATFERTDWRTRQNAGVGLFSSPRRRRRAVRLGVAGVAVASLIFLGVRFSNPGNPGNANGPLVNEDNSQPKAAPFTKQDRQAVHQVLRKFVLTAVDRQDVGSSWQISAPSLREGFTRKQWSHGNLPVVPYPAANRGLGDWSFVQYSYKGLVGLEVYPLPEAGLGLVGDDRRRRARQGPRREVARRLLDAKRSAGRRRCRRRRRRRQRQKAQAARAKAKVKRAHPVVSKKAAAPAPARLRRRPRSRARSGGPCRSRCWD